MPEAPLPMTDDPVGSGPRAGLPVPVQSQPAAGRRAAQWPVLAAVSLGGMAGASARYGAALLWLTADGAFPWTTFVVNTAGCSVIGVFMVVISEARSVHRLVRPFFGTGVLGGFTTFSTYAVDIQGLVNGGHARTALAYLALTLLSALAAVWATASLTRRFVVRRRS
ncbi:MULTISPECIES: CrcB family protein [unclassified Streptomyces]|uniref:fluoride efflux transporter FluC n=1 Tax=unclassified Streptomyces TaxID=2593676 RepID=UPI002E155101|nr:CrcB family protein [Streptomyces sp. NBC_01197]WSS47526.1 CrcB family protein [Streptomyces sp. NBC_01180]